MIVDTPVSVAEAQMEEAAGMFAALADPARLRLLILLSPGEASVSDLAAAQAEKLTTVSARLEVLHAARLVGRKRQGKSISTTWLTTTCWPSWRARWTTSAKTAEDRKEGPHHVRHLQDPPQP